MQISSLLLATTGQNTKMPFLTSFWVRSIHRLFFSGYSDAKTCDDANFLRTGQLNQNELSFQIDYFITADPHVEHLHNQFMTALYGNVSRDPPEPGVAAWVSSNDKPVAVSKPVTGDAAEQRLKTEVKQLPAKDRRRLKAIPEVSVLLLCCLNMNVAAAFQDLWIDVV